MEHQSVDPDSDLRLKINHELSANNKENTTFAVYLAAYKTKCRYVQNGMQCTGNPVLKCLRRHDNTTPPSYFISCSKWKINEKYHRFISVKDDVDLNLLSQLLNGQYEGETDEPVNNCSTILHNNSKKTNCPHSHRAGNIIKQGSIIRKICGVKYTKIIPHDLEKCPYIILISKGIHSHPPPPPSHVPVTIWDRLQELIRQANDDTVDVTPTRIITGNLIKTYFGTEYLADVHASLNNADRLRYYVDKIQKEIHLQGCGILGVIYNYSRNINNFCEYVKRLEFFEDNHYMIICTTSEQLTEWTKCKNFQIDLSFKRVAGEINEFEINYYNNEHNLILTFARIFTNNTNTIAYQRMFRALFDLVKQLTGSSVQFQHIHKAGWNCIIADLNYAQTKGLGFVLNEINGTKSWEEHLIYIFKSCHVHYKRKIREKHYDDSVKNNMYAFLSAESENMINKLFNNIQMADESTSDWIAFYRQNWVIVSLNKCISKIDNEVWIASPDNTNIAEAAHALSNCCGKNLKLVTAIIQGRKLDKERFTAINVHQKYSIPNRGRDKGLIARNIQSNKRKAHTQTKRSNMTKSVPVKRKQNRQSNNNKKKSKKTIVIDSDIEEDCKDSDYKEDNKENELALKLKELEYQEKDLALKERELALREREAKIRVMELSNCEKERQLNLAD
ncbi:hypothetical protein RhiirC2_716774 [Rhizophagus irregularis]|uniref:MULE transposase domain-containing protein n=1 Tax=Rhizophagus irregularis TaxID=588596 RepID=A0A2N1MPZ8_9GLOM|nr:hypothetical protein RhiirC2_716774 [Rhizophagus irregularis]